MSLAENEQNNRTQLQVLHHQLRGDHRHTQHNLNIGHRLLQIMEERSLTPEDLAELVREKTDNTDLSLNEPRILQILGGVAPSLSLREISGLEHFLQTDLLITNLAQPEKDDAPWPSEAERQEQEKQRREEVIDRFKKWSKGARVMFEPGAKPNAGQQLVSGVFGDGDVMFECSEENPCPICQLRKRQQEKREAAAATTEQELAADPAPESEPISVNAQASVTELPQEEAPATTKTGWSRVAARVQERLNTTTVASGRMCREGVIRTPEGIVEVYAWRNEQKGTSGGYLGFCYDGDFYQQPLSGYPEVEVLRQMALTMASAIVMASKPESNNAEQAPGA